MVLPADRVAHDLDGVSSREIRIWRYSAALIPRQDQGGVSIRTRFRDGPTPPSFREFHGTNSYSSPFCRQRVNILLVWGGNVQENQRELNDRQSLPPAWFRTHPQPHQSAEQRQVGVAGTQFAGPHANVHAPLEVAHRDTGLLDEPES
jgi:hypothetical protein